MAPAIKAAPCCTEYIAQCIAVQQYGSRKMEYKRAGQSGLARAGQTGDPDDASTG